MNISDLINILKLLISSLLASTLTILLNIKGLFPFALGKNLVMYLILLTFFYLTLGALRGLRGKKLNNKKINIKIPKDVINVNQVNI